MEKKRILAILMAVFMVLSMLPTMAFAAATGELGGKVKIKGLPAVGSTLSVDYTKVEPAGMTDDVVSFQWFRQFSDDGSDAVAVGTEKTYTVTEEDLGAKISLQINGLEEMGVTGSLTAKSKEVKATTEEAQADADADPEADQEADVQPDAENQEDIQQTEDETQEEPSEDAQESGVLQEEIPEATEDGQTDTEAPEENQDIQVEELPQEAEQPVEENQEQIQIDESTQNIENSNAEEAVYMAEAVSDDQSQILDFGQLEDGYEDVEAQYITIKNTGTGELNFSEMSPEHFMVQDIEGPLQPGEAVSVWVQPRIGLEAGEYTDTISYTSQEGATASFEAKVTVGAAEELEETETPSGEDPDMQVIIDPDAEDPDMQPDKAEEPAETPAATPAASVAPGEDEPGYSITVDPTETAFSDLEEGYESVSETQSVNVTNNGDSPVTLVVHPTAYFQVTPLAESEEMGLESGKSASFNIQPVLDLPGSEDPYEETIYFGIEEDEEITAEVTASVTVNTVEPVVTAVTADPTSYDFTEEKTGYTDPEQTTITLSNDGNTDVVLTQPEAINFQVGELTADSLAPGESTTFTVQPETGLDAGTYEEDIDIYLDGEEDTPVATVTVSFMVSNPDPVYQLTVSPTDLNFGNKETGYQQSPEAQNVTVTNNGNTDIHLTQPSSTNFQVGALTAAVIKPGESSTFSVQPNAGLAQGNYQETILIPNKENASAKVNVQFSVTKQTVKLVSVKKASDIVGVKNGTKKSQSALGIPATVKIETTNGTMKANVDWDIKGCSYDSSVTDAQVFSVKGKVALPEGIENPDDVSLVTSVKVSVDGYAGKKVSAEGNMITGIDVQHAYTTESKISFTAVGAGMDNENPRKGDERYVPANWTVIKTNKWDSAPYEATFGIVKAGSYTLSVEFTKQRYTDKGWSNTGETDTKQVPLTIVNAVSGTVTPTPVPSVTNTSHKAAVLTGDNTKILPFIIILIIAAGCIAGVVIYRKKK